MLKSGLLLVSVPVLQTSGTLVALVRAVKKSVGKGGVMRISLLIAKIS
jgi:hypothetical protein